MNQPQSQAYWLGTGSLQSGLFALLTVVAFSAAFCQTAEADRPTIADLVASHFAAKSGYMPGDLIQRSDFDAIVKALEDNDLAFASSESAESIRLRIPGNESFIQQQLSGSRGRAFMRQLARIPNGYAQFATISQAPNGRSAAQTVLRQPGGADLIRYMAQTPGGAKLKSQISGRRRPRRGSQPKAIYTAGELSRAILAAQGGKPSS